MLHVRSHDPVMSQQPLDVLLADQFYTLNTITPLYWILSTYLYTSLDTGIVTAYYGLLQSMGMQQKRSTEKGFCAQMLKIQYY